MAVEPVTQLRHQPGTSRGCEQLLAGLTRHGRHCQQYPFARQGDQAHVLQCIAVTQAHFDGIQRDAPFLDLDDAVRPALQHELAIRIDEYAITGTEPVGIRQVRRAHFEVLFAHAAVHAGQRAPCMAGAVSLAPGDAAGFGASEDFDRRKLPQCLHLLGGIHRQRPAGRKHRGKIARECLPVLAGGQALQVRRACDQRDASVIEFRQPLVVDHPQSCRCAPCGQRPQHPEQQAVDVLVRHRAMHGRTLQAVAECGFQCRDFGIQLAQALADRGGLAGGAGGEQHQFAALRIQRLFRLGSGGIRCSRLQPVRQLAGEHQARIRKTRQGCRQCVRGQPGRGVGLPGGK